MNKLMFMESSKRQTRLASIDMLRGLVILFMLLDHVRETFFLHLQVDDPMDVTTTSLSLFISRTIAHICAPAFILLTGISAYLYGQKQGSNASHCKKKAIATFLFKRGVFLITLELTVINFAWTSQFPPTVIYLQVIWAIGLSMIALSMLLWLPKNGLLVLSLIIIFGHNMLDTLHADTMSSFFIPWAIIHDRGWIIFDAIRIRTSYPVLPWIGVIGFGYCLGSLFDTDVKRQQRCQWLCSISVGLLLLFVIIRFINIYGDKLPWLYFDYTGLTIMSFFSVTKYPPSLLFILFTLSITLLLLVLFERCQTKVSCNWLSTFGSVPMFFYIIHLYILKLLYLLATQIWGKNKGEYFGFDEVWQIWFATVLVAIIIYPLVRWFSAFKASHRHILWLKYL